MILIDRLAPDTDLGIATRLLRGNDWEAEIADNRWYSTSTVVSEDGESSRNNIRISLSMAKSRSARYEDPLALQPVTEANALQIVKDWSKSKWTQDAEMRVRETLQADDQLARPLFAALIGDAIRTDDLPRGVLNPVTVASAALERLFRRHDEKSDSYSEQAKILLAAATVGQGLPEDELFDDNKILCDLIGETHLSDTGMKELKRRVQKFAGSCSSQEIPPVEPDFLGGLFVLERLLSLSRKRALPKADLIMSIAWKLGRNPGAFVVRLAADFIGRGEQVAAAVARGSTPSDGTRVNEILVHLILSGLRAEALLRNGHAAVAYTVYLASKAGEGEVATELIEALGQLLERHDTAEIAFHQAQALYNATAGEPDPRRREVLAERIGPLLERHDTAEIPLYQAKALVSATVREPDPQRWEALAERIGPLLERHDTAEIALYQAKALVSATVREPDPRQCAALAERIGHLLERHDTAEIALEQAQALLNATVREPDPQRWEALAERIGQLLERHDTAEIALEQAQALLNATVREPDPRRREALAERIGQLLERHDTAEIALCQGGALYNATEVEPDVTKQNAINAQIAELAARYGPAWKCQTQNYLQLDQRYVREDEHNKLRSMGIPIRSASKA